jgi:hypothetical protein
VRGQLYQDGTLNANGETQTVPSLKPGMAANRLLRQTRLAGEVTSAAFSC